MKQDISISTSSSSSPVVVFNLDTRLNYVNNHKNLIQYTTKVFLQKNGGGLLDMLGDVTSASDRSAIAGRVALILSKTKTIVIREQEKIIETLSDSELLRDIQLINVTVDADGVYIKFQIINYAGERLGVNV